MSKITIKKPGEIDKLRAGGKILATILEGLTNAVRPGITTEQLEKLARKLMAEFGVKPSFLGFGNPPYPSALCLSVNNEVVHCVPSNRKLAAGDIIGIDAGIWHQGLCTDMARTVAVGKISDQTKKLIEVTKQALAIAERAVRPKARIGEIGFAVQQFVESQSFSVVRQLVGHGVGYQVHEAPRVPNFGKPDEGEILKPGMVLALEPMVNLGLPGIAVRNNQWDIVTKDGSWSAHFEDTVVVTDQGCEVLTVHHQNLVA